jgi:ADP-ribose pyrophosphatase YjhB (NUDIX family)
VARDLARTYPTKEKLEEALVETARRPAHERAYANYWANPGSAFPARYTVDLHVRRIIREEGGELTAPPPWMAKVPRQEKIYTVPVMKFGMTPILVTGDADRNKVQTMPGGNSATIEIKLPANWDELMEKLGYRPLEEFFLSQEAPKRE